MSTSHGYSTIVGWVREAVVSAPTWPAAAATAVTTMIPALSVDSDDGIVLALNSSVEQGYGLASQDILAKAPTLRWTSALRYQGYEQLFACALGFMARRIGATNMPETIATGAFRHLIEIDPMLATSQGWAFGDGFRFGAEVNFGQRKVRRGTAAIARQVSVWEHLSAMVDRLTLTGSLERVTCEVQLRSYSLSRASAVNTAAILTALPLASAPQVLFRHGVLRLGTFSAGTPLGSGNEVGVTDWQLVIDNRLRGVPGPRTALAPEEFEKEGLAEITLALTLPRYTSDQRFTDWATPTILMGDLKMTGPNIPGTSTAYQCNLYFPSLVLTEVTSPVQGSQVPGMTHQASMRVPTAAPAGFPTMFRLGPLAVEVRSGQASHPLL